MGEINKQQLERKALITQQALLLAGVAGAKEKGRPNVLTVLKHTISIGVRPHILIISLTYYMFLVMWTVGLATTIPLLVLPPPYTFSETSTALLYLAPAIGGLVGEVWGHFFNDHLCRSYLRKHNNEWLPEQRLWAVYPAVAIGICALVLIGQSLQNGLPWIALAFGWGMYSAATVITSTVVSAYILDCFPKHSALASSIINFWRTTGGFSVVYFQFKWIALNGAAIVFGCQAGIVAAGFLGVVATQIWGPVWRSRYPPPPAEN
ncbi:hypothetical protein Egran_00551 [Elaphomyces granulatus]|uniref:Major facilitator superfamily (MFS) profile domain-containing protein n=1 Tax=Elaphomyces granulatus TaxID=519963 RepID=A0A232M5S7_9EURO|nr:hypothetical protein Egran_00551 [Elaphomyces granulatus]